MSRSKEGFDKDENSAVSRPTEEPSKSRYLDERLGAEGQTDYTSGRESWSEYPRKSSSFRARNENRRESGDRDDSSLQGDNWDRNRSSRTAPYAGSYRPREEQTYYNRERGEQGRANFYDRENQFDYDDFRESGRESGRHSYNDLRYGKADHEDLPRGAAGYRPRERRYSEYDRDNYRDNFRRERGDYDAPYNREALSGRYDYDRGYETGGEAYGYRSARDLRGEHRGRETHILRCCDIMTKDVTVCSPQTVLRDVAEKMQSDGIGSIPVVEGGRLVGIVTDRDIVCRVIADGRDTRSTTVSEAMSNDVVTCGPDDSVHEAIRKMGENQVRRIPVSDSTGRLRGIIAMADIALEAERDRELADALERISQPTPSRSRRR